MARATVWSKLWGPCWVRPESVAERTSEGVDPMCGRNIVFCADGTTACQVGSDVFRQAFAIFNAPLVKWVDTPYDSLYENLVFVQCQQGTQRVG